MAVELQHELSSSLDKAEEFPQNLIFKHTNIIRCSLKTLHSQLDKARLRLFTDDATSIEIPIRDIEAPLVGKSVNVHSSNRLDEVLGLQKKIDPVTSIAHTYSIKKDPKCRLVYLYAGHSRAKLNINSELFSRVLSYHQVMPAYLDFILAFGAHSEAEDMMFSGFRTHSTLTEPARGFCAPHLGRSGRQYQLCYNLKQVVQTKEDVFDEKNNMWSVRQAAFYHQFDVIQGTTLWVVTKGRRDLYEAFQDHTRADSEGDISFDSPLDCFKSSLGVHLLWCHWATEGWRWYVRWLENKVRQETGVALYDTDEAHAEEIRPNDIASLHRREDTVAGTIMTLESNINTMSLLKNFYTQLLNDTNFPRREECTSDVTDFAARVDDMIQGFRMDLSRAGLLLKITSDRKQFIMQTSQHQASKRMEKLSIKMEKEAVMVRIITFVTLLYLPPTFISTFFSTDVIKYQNPDGPPGTGTYSKAAMERWLQVTVPLTVVTILLAYLAYKRASLTSAGRELRTRYDRAGLKVEAPFEMKRMVKRLTASSLV